MTITALLLLVGLVVAVHAICVATDIPEGTPLVFGLEAVLMFTAGVGGMVFAAFADPETSAIFLLFAFLLKAIFMVDALRRGYTITGIIVTEYKSHSPK